MTNILIVDDDVQTADYIAELLEAHGYQTTWAFDGQDALKQLRRTMTNAAISDQAFDLVLLDLMIPGIDGYEVCRRIKKDELLCHLPIIMVTGLGSTSNKTRGLDLGADDYTCDCDAGYTWNGQINLCTSGAVGTCDDLEDCLLTCNGFEDFVY